MLISAIFKLVTKIVNGKCCGGVPSLRSRMASVADDTESALHAISGLQRANSKIISESCSHDRVLDHGRAAPGIETGTSRTRRENHSTRPSSRLERVYRITRETSASVAGCIFCTPHGRRSICSKIQAFPYHISFRTLLAVRNHPLRDSNPQLPIRSPAPCPLGQGGRCIMYMSSLVRSGEKGHPQLQTVGVGITERTKKTNNND